MSNWVILHINHDHVTAICTLLIAPIRLPSASLSSKSATFRHPFRRACITLLKNSFSINAASTVANRYARPPSESERKRSLDWVMSMFRTLLPLAELSTRSRWRRIPMVPVAMQTQSFRRRLGTPEICVARGARKKCRARPARNRKRRNASQILECFRNAPGMTTGIC